MFVVEHKDEFEMLKIYTDNYPLLEWRKNILFAMKVVSWICFKIIKHPYFEAIVLCIILLNTGTLIMFNPNDKSTTI